MNLMECLRFQISFAERSFSGLYYYLILLLVDIHELSLIGGIIIVIFHRRPYLILTILTIRLNLYDIVKINHGNTRVYDQRASIFDSQRFTIPIHITEESISVSEKYRKVTIQQTIANHCGRLPTLAHSCLVSND